jgi:hypothetical protein
MVFISFMKCSCSSSSCFSIFMFIFIFLQGCTARRAVLGIHRTQAGRSGSRLGRGQRVEARCSMATPSIDSATSATGPGRTAAGRCRPPSTTRRRPGRGSPPAAVAGPGAVPHRHRKRAMARCPARDYSSPGWGPAAATAPGRRYEPGPGPFGPSPVRGPAGRLTVPQVADCRFAARAARGTDRRTASPSAGCHTPGRRWWGQCRGRGRPGEAATICVGP